MRLAGGDAVVSLDPAAGGRLASLTLAGADVLAPRADAAAAAPSLTWGGYPMAPWVGRLEGARFAWDGEVVALPADHGRHAIHGLCHTAPFTVRTSGPGRVTLAAGVAHPPWPWPLTFTQEVDLSPDRLVVRGVLAGDAVQPVALGWHPWFRRSLAGSDPADCALTVPAARVLVTDDDLVATGTTVAVDARTDLQRGPRLADRRLDTTYVGLTGPALLRWPGLTLTLTPGPGIVALHVYCTDAHVCLEPLSAWPNAHVLAGRGFADTGLAVVAATQPLAAAWMLAWERP